MAPRGSAVSAIYINIQTDTGICDQFAKVLAQNIRRVPLKNIGSGT